MAEDFHDQIQWLARNGVATHLIRNPASVDSVFAVAKVQDLPGITFAASFDDGSLAVGCSGDLPEVLIDMAEQIPVEEDASFATDAPDLSEKIEALTEALANQNPPTVPDYSDQFATLQQAIEAIDVPQLPPSPALEDIVSGIVQALPAADIDLDAIAQRVKEAIDEPQPSAQVESQLAAMSDTLAKLTPNAGSDDALIARFDALESTLAEGSPATQLTRIEKLLAAVHSQSETDLTPMQSTLSEIAETVQSIANAPRAEASADNALHEGIQTELAELKSLLNAQAELQVQSVDLSVIEAQIVQTTDAILALSARETVDQPIVDLSGVEAQVAQLTSTIESLSTVPQGAAPEVSGLEAQISALAAQIDGFTNSELQDSLSRIEAQLGQLSDSPVDAETLEDMNDKLATLLSVDAKIQTLAVQIAAMGKRGDPASKESAQNIIGPLQVELDKGFTSIRTSLDTMTAPKDAPDDARIDAILAQLQTMQEHPIEQPSSDAAIAELQNTIMARLDDLATRPDADSELSVLHENEAQFTTAQAELMHRLEAAIAEVSAAQTAAPTDAFDLDLSPVIAMIAQMSQAQSAALEGLQRLEDAIDRMMENPQQQSEGTDSQSLTLIKDQISTLANAHHDDVEALRSDLAKLAIPGQSLPDVTTQIQTFARLNSALSSVLDRLDLSTDRVTQAVELVKQGPTQPPPAEMMLADMIERLKKDLINSLHGYRDAVPVTGQSKRPPIKSESLAQALGTVIDQFEVLTDRLQHPHPNEEIIFRSGANKRGNEISQSSYDIKNSFEEDDLISLKDLRNWFAETLAQHIQDTNGPKPNGTAHR